MAKLIYKQRCDELLNKWQTEGNISSEEINFLFEVIRRISNLNDEYFKKINSAKFDSKSKKYNINIDPYCDKLLELGFKDHCSGCVFIKDCKKLRNTQVFCIKQYFNRLESIQKMLKESEKREKIDNELNNK